MADTLIRLYEGSGRRAQCRGCNADIVWFDTLSGKKMPMNAAAQSKKSELDPVRRRVVLFFAASDAHWATCPEKAQFSRRAK
jgi:hypothetical protein